jgi:hypothetical protein
MDFKFAFEIFESCILIFFMKTTTSTHNIRSRFLLPPSVFATYCNLFGQYTPSKSTHQDTHRRVSEINLVEGPSVLFLNYELSRVVNS